MVGVAGGGGSGGVVVVRAESSGGEVQRGVQWCPVEPEARTCRRSVVVFF